MHVHFKQRKVSGTFEHFIYGHSLSNKMSLERERIGMQSAPCRANVNINYDKYECLI